MTPAIETLKKANIQFTLHEYSHDPQAASYGEEAANCLDVEAQRVFKTLLVSGNSNDNSKDLAVSIVPVTHQLDLKAVAKAIKVKKTSMADASAAQKATGYILGGISPLGQKKRLPFTIDSSAIDYETVFISGGKRGLEIEIAPEDLIALCNAKISDIKAK